MITTRNLVATPPCPLRQAPGGPGIKGLACCAPFRVLAAPRARPRRGGLLQREGLPVGVRYRPRHERRLAGWPVLDAAGQECAAGDGQEDPPTPVMFSHVA
jgi:hypothetical protein